MRTRDQAKYDAILHSTIHLTNTLGFDHISIAKIAKHAQVSPATIYIYFTNKTDLFTKLYIAIREEMDETALQGVHDGMSTEATFKTLWYNSFTNNLAHPEYLSFREQFEQTSMMKAITHSEFASYRSITTLMERGVREHTIKNLPIPLLTAFAFFPMMTLLKFHLSHRLIMDPATLAQAINLAWTIIKF